MDKAIKWGYFILYTKEISAEDLLEVYIKEVFARHGAPMKIILDQDPRFVAVFWETFITKQGTQMATLMVYYL